MRRVRKKVGNKDKVFGCDLLEHLTATCQEIPQVLQSCSEFIEEHGVVDGIYRLSGVSSNTQKLRGEFDIEGTPDLNKDVYLQDIHCVSGLCKAYFRELPNPLLTYQLYDKFAEAVNLQMEDERLVKIKDVLKELPAPHYKTLEFLMRHLVTMASHSSHTNMHSRNLAIVWAPNLLRSKDIESSGFNGTAAFMEVRVQSIVVEFILTHVPQLFPDLGTPIERRKSLPPPSVLPGQEEPLRPFPFQSSCSYGNISPGDGPLPIRPYHAIIDPIDKRKGSLKGRKWKSIFNLGGRLHDPRRRHKNSGKDKEKPNLRSAKSMDSLSAPYEGSKQPPPSPHTSPMAIPSPTLQGAVEGGPSGGGMGSGYAVTYRRGAGASVSVVSGGGGTQGVYSRLDPGGGGTSTEVLQTQSRSPGLSNKADRRAGIHISGPFSVTVPLHITSGLAFGVLQGVGGDKGSRRGGQGSGEREEGGEGGRLEEGDRHIKRKEAKEDERDGGKSREVKVREESGRNGVEEDEGTEEKGEREKEEEERGETVHVDCVPMPVREMTEVGGGQGEENHDNDQEENYMEDEEGEYMDMKGSLEISLEVLDASGVSEQSGPAAVSGGQGVVEQSDLPDLPDPTEEYEEGQDCPLDFQDTFGFLDLMDSSASNQMHEFSVEPPFHEEDYEDMVEQTSPTPSLERPQLSARPPAGAAEGPRTGTGTSTLKKAPFHRPLTTNQYGRPNKSLSLPFMMAPPFTAALSSTDEEEEENEDNYETDEDDEDDGDMFYKSLPSSLQFNRLTWAGPATDTVNDQSPPPVPSEPLDSTTVHRIPTGQSQGSEVKSTSQDLDTDSSECRDPAGEALGQEQSPAEDEDDGQGRTEEMEEVEEEEEVAEEDTDNQEKDLAEILTNTCMQSIETEDVSHSVEPGIIEEDAAPGDNESGLTSAPSTTDFEESSLPRTADQETVDPGAALLVEDKEEVLENHHDKDGSLEGNHGDTLSGMESEDSQVHIPQSRPRVSSVAESDTMVNVPSEDVIQDSPESPIEQPQDSVEREREGEREEREEEMEERGEDGNGGECNKQEEEEMRTVGEGEIGKVELVEERGDTEEEEEGGEEREQGGEIEQEEAQKAEEEEELGGEGKEEEAVCREVSLEDEDAISEMIGSGESGHKEKKEKEKDDSEGETEGRDITEDTVQVKEERGGDEGEKKEVITEEMEEEEESMAVEEMGVPEEWKEEGDEGMIVKEECKTGTGNEPKAQPIIERREMKGGSAEEGNGEGVKEIQVNNVIRDGHEDVLAPQKEDEDSNSTESDNEDGEMEKKEKAEQMTEERQEERQEIRVNSKDWREEKREEKRRETDHKIGSEQGQGRMLVTSKQTAPKVYQAKSVPVVPPKPQHCRLTALSLRQQQQQRERVEADGEKGRARRAGGEQDSDKPRDAEEEAPVRERGGGGRGERERRRDGEEEAPVRERGGGGRGERERRIDGEAGGARGAARNSPVSMCFDKAVAMETIKRGREKGSCDREQQKERGFEVK